MSQVQENIQENNEQKQFIDGRTGALIGGGAALAAGAAILAQEQPASAAGIEDVSTTVTSLGGLAGAALVVALVPFGIFFAIKIVKRVMNA